MDVKFADDFKLVERWKAGSETAYKMLFDKYFGKLYHYTLKVIADKEIAEEIVMDVMMNIWQKKHLINNDLPISAYLFRSVKNKMIDHHRKNALKTISIDNTDGCLELVSHMRADNRVIEGELELQYHNGLNTLSPQKKVVFMLSRNEGLTYQEIAQKLNISKNTVENHMVAALKLLKVHIGN
jgi:RNA polymerase sigma-70 factor (family 1)